MADFNPNLPDIEPPNYAYMARGIRPPRPSPVGEMVGKGLADTLQVGLKGADFVHKTNIDNELHQKQDEFNAQRLSEVYEAEDTLVGRGNLPEEGSNIDPKVIDEMTSKLDRADKLFEYGKYSQLRYDTERAALVSQVKSKYPSVEDRDYIESKAARSYREDPTNQVIRGKIAQLNYLYSQTNSQNNRLRKEAYDTPGGAAAYNAYMKNPSEKTRMGLESLIADWKQTEAGAKKAKIDRDTAKAQGVDVSQKAYNDLQEDLTKRVHVYFDGLKLGSGSDIDEWMRKIQNHEIEPSQDEYANAQIALNSAIDQFRISAMKYASDHYTARDLGENGSVKLREAIDNTVKPWKDFVDSIGKQNGGYALAQVEADKRKDESFVLGIKKAFPELVLQKEFPNSPLAERMANEDVAKGTSPQMRAYMGTIYKGIFGSNTSTFHDVISVVNQPDPKMSDKDRSALANRTMEAINQLPESVKSGLKPGGDISEALRLNQFAYDPKNVGILDQFKKEKPGSAEAGRMAAYGHLVADKQADASWTLRQHGHPEAWKNYAGFTEETARGLIQEEIKTLQTFQDKYGFKEAEGTPSGMHGARTYHPDDPWKNTTINWDDTNSRWVLKSDIPSATGSRKTSWGATVRTPSIHSANPDSWHRDELEQSVNRANEILDGLKTIPKHEGGDVNDYILNFMIQHVGLDPSSRGLQFSDHIMRSLVNSKLQREGTQLRTNEGP